MDHGDIDANARTNFPAAVPIFVRMAWEAKVPKGKRSATITALVKLHLGMQLSDKEKKLVRR